MKQKILSSGAEAIIYLDEKNKVIKHRISKGYRYPEIDKKIIKRINGLIAIVKYIEKNQTKPTVAMLQALFEQAAPENKSLMVEKKVLLEKKQNNAHNKQ